MYLPRYKQEQKEEKKIVLCFQRVPKDSATCMYVCTCVFVIF